MAPRQINLLNLPRILAVAGLKIDDVPNLGLKRK